MCYEFSGLFEKARARELRRQHEQQPRDSAGKDPQPAPQAPPPAVPAEATRQREKLPV
jgi:hypothetical protein